MALPQQNVPSAGAPSGRYYFNKMLHQGGAPSAGTPLMRCSQRVVLPQQGTPSASNVPLLEHVCRQPSGLFFPHPGRGLCSQRRHTRRRSFRVTDAGSAALGALGRPRHTFSKDPVNHVGGPMPPPLPGLAPGTCWRQPTSWGSPGPLCHLPNPACLLWAFPHPCVPGQLWPGHPQHAALR